MIGIRRRRTVAGVAALLMVVAGCGDTEPDPAADEDPIDAADPPPAETDPAAPPAEAASTSSERLTRRSVDDPDGAPLGYAEYLPPDPTTGDGMPLLVFLHGSDEAGEGTTEALDRLFVHGLPALIRDDGWPDDRPFVVLMPQYPEGLARSCDLSDDIAGFLAFALDRYDVDPRRVYLTGVSCGASGIWGYLAEHGDEVVAAAVPIAGRAVGAFNAAGCELGRVPSWVFHGADDDIVPTAGVVPSVEALQACTDPSPVDVRLTVYPGVSHEAWDRTYDLSAGHDIYTWLLEHERS